MTYEELADFIDNVSLIMTIKSTTDTSFAIHVGLELMKSWLNEANIPAEVKKLALGGIDCYKNPVKCD